MKTPVTKKLIPALLIGFLVVATLLFVLFVGNKNPSDALKRAEKEKLEQQVRSTPDGEESDAKRRLAEMEKEVRQLRLREQAAIDAKMARAATGEDKEDEAKRVAKNLQIELPRAPAGSLGVAPPENPELAARMESAHRDQTNASANLGVFESYQGGPGAVINASGGAGQAGEAPRSTNSDRAGNERLAATNAESGIKNQPPPPVILPKLAASRKYMLAEGSVIRTVFVTAVNSHNPGKTIVRVTEDVYDSITGYNLLIPKGTQIVGKYDGEVKAGQDRLVMSFERLVFPDGRSIPLPKMPAITRTGETGTDGEYHSNLLPSIMPSLIMGLFGTAVDYFTTKGVVDSINTNTNTGYNNTTNATVTPSQSVARQVFPDMSKRLAERYADRKPYFTIEPGATFMVMVTADFAIPPGEGAQLIGSKN